MNVSFSLNYEFSHDCDDEVKAKEDIETTLEKSMLQFLSEFPKIKNVENASNSVIILQPNQLSHVQSRSSFNFDVKDSYPCKILQQVVDTLETNFEAVILKKVSEYPVIKSVKKMGGIIGQYRI